MNIQDFDLNLLRTFEAIYAERHLTRASERLDVAQPTISNALARLRKQLNDPLFVRTSSGMQPTPLAESLADKVLEGLSLVREGLEHTLNFDPTRSTRRLRIAMSDYTGSVILPNLVATARSQAPNIEFMVLPLRRNEAQEALKSGRLDVVITDNLNGAGLYQRTIYQESFVSLVSKNHPTIQNHLTLEQFLAHSHVLYTLDGKGNGVVDRVLAEQGLKRHIAVRVPHVSVIPNIVEQSELIVTLPKRVALQFQQAWALSVLKTPLEIPHYTLNQYWHEKFHRDPAHQWLRQLINDCLDHSPSE